MSQREALLTWGLIILSGTLVLVNLLPRVSVQRSSVERIQPNITVSISGAIKSPGVYELAWGAKLNDLVELAGGLSPAAELTLVNLADPLDMGETVVIPYRRTGGGDDRISLNSATVSELDSLPGIGPALARRIMARRPYSNIEDLQKVSGIGPASLEKLRPLVRP